MALFATSEAFNVLDITDLAHPRWPVASMALAEAHSDLCGPDLCLCGGRAQGLVILDIEEPGAAARSIRSSMAAAASMTCTM